ncbi:N-acetylneuraminate epimerase [Sulfuracidifex tepidarius]|uniref:N-acetylneuraminate epimerase n=1 Tax=Sulfuracidifex tepidarius TaxID=1294262 RepID=A0A510DTN1_9CREN|nr:fibronectin type III domain-containing protein [Sulfuracidifex tepidarius]BBG23583.1 N-acetylneuraminate epimerase [Sulfuracidifex tepidarius]
MKWRHASIALVFVLSLISFLSPIASASISGVQVSQISLPQPIFGDTSVSYDNSLVLIGENTNLGSNVIEYQGGTWQPLPPIPVNLCFPSAVVYQGKIYVIGGVLPSGKINDVVYVFNGTSWSSVGQPEPNPAYGSYIFVYNGEIYVVGGSVTTSSIYFATPPSSAVRVFNPSSGSWNVIGEAPYPMGDGGYVFNGTDLIVVGGYLGGYSASYTNQVSMYDPSSNTWYSLTPFPMQLGYPQVAYLNGVLFVAGGIMFTTVGLDEGRVYYMVNGSWYQSYNYENPPLFQSSYVQIGNELYVVGGYNGDTSEVSSVVDVLKINVPPLVPSQPNVIASNETALIQWSPVNFSSGYYLRVTHDGIQSVIKVGNVTSYNLTGLVDGQTYDVSVMAYNQAGNSSWSPTDTFTPLAVPNPPNVVSVKLGDLNVSINFSSPQFDGGSPVKGFYVYLENSTFRESFKLPYGSNYFNFTGLQNGSAYRVKLIAFNSLGNSSPSVLDFVAVGKPVISLYSQSTSKGLLIRWGSNLYSNYTVKVFSRTSLVYSGNFSNLTGTLIKIPFGVYKVLVIARNPAGVTESTLNVNYFLPPSMPFPLVEVANGNLTVYIPKTPDVQYYKVYLDGNLTYTGNKTEFSMPISPDINYNLSVVAVNPVGSSTPFTAVVSYHSHPTVTPHGKVINRTAYISIKDPQLPVVDSISIIVLTISALWIVQQILRKEAESKDS